MNVLRSDRVAAVLLLAAAAIGVWIANSPLSEAVLAARDLRVGPAFLHLDLSLGHWVSDGLLALFFLLAAIELRHELQRGELDSVRTAVVPVVAAVAGVALGLVMSPAPAERAREALTPWTNGIVLPLFAFTASLVALPALGPSGLGPVFWAIVVALPLGKLIGIGAGAAIAGRLTDRTAGSVPGTRLPPGDVAVIATLGGVGFTVSLLINELAFADFPDLRTQGTLGVLTGSVAAIVLGIVVTVLRARRVSRLR